MLWAEFRFRGGRVEGDKGDKIQMIYLGKLNSYDKNCEISIDIKTKYLIKNIVLLIIKYLRNTVIPHCSHMIGWKLIS